MPLWIKLRKLKKLLIDFYDCKCIINTDFTYYSQDANEHLTHADLHI